MKKHFLGLSTIAIVWLSCAGTYMPHHHPRLTTHLTEWPQLYESNFQYIHNLTGRARLTVETPDVSGHMDLTVYWVAPDTLLLKAEGPLGVDVGTIMIGSHRFIIYNQYNNQFIAGNLSDTYIARFLQTDFSLSDLKPIILGKAPLETSRIQLVDAQHGVFVNFSGGKKFRYHVDPTTGLLLSLSVLENGTPLYQMKFKKYMNVGPVVFPRIIQLIRTQPLQRLSLFYKSITINGEIPLEKLVIRVPPNVRQLNLE